MARLVDFSFNLSSASANNGKIVVSMDNTDAPGTPYSFYIGITSPSGEEIKALPTSTPDAELDGGESGEFTVDIPLDSSGAYLDGTYVFTIRRAEGELAGATVTASYQFTAHNAPDNLSGTPSLAVSFDCLTGIILATDTTDYTSSEIVLEDREITITPPSIDPQSPATGASATKTLVVAFTNVTYQASMSVAYSVDEEDVESGVTVNYTGSVLLYKEVAVTCETGGICASLECIGEELTKAYQQACAAGGYPRLAQASKDKIEFAMMNLTMAKLKYDCGEISDSLIYLARAKEGINCGCGCSGDSTDTTPRPYTPPAAASVATPELLYWVEDEDTGQKFAMWTPKMADDDVHAVVAPKGTGGFRLRDAGDARGENSIDLQIATSDDNQVASGAFSAVVGSNNRASGLADVAIGSGNVVTGSASAGVGVENVVTADSAGAYGYTNNVSGDGSQAVGTANNLSGLNSYALGSAMTLAGENSVGLGALGHSRMVNQIVTGLGFSGMQHSLLSPYRAGISSNSAFLVTLAGTNINDIVFPTQNSGNWMYACRLMLAGAITTGGGGFTQGEGFLYEYRFVIANNGGTVALVGSVVTVGTDIESASLSTTAVAITADDTNNMLQIQVTPPSGLTGGPELSVLGKLEIMELAL